MRGVCRHPLHRKDFSNKNSRIDCFLQEIVLLLLTPYSNKQVKAQQIGISRAPLNRLYKGRFLSAH